MVWLFLTTVLWHRDHSGIRLGWLFDFQDWIGFEMIRFVTVSAGFQFPPIPGYLRPQNGWVHRAISAVWPRMKWLGCLRPIAAVYLSDMWEALLLQRGEGWRQHEKEMSFRSSNQLILQRSEFSKWESTLLCPLYMKHFSWIFDPEIDPKYLNSKGANLNSWLLKEQN